MITWTIGAGGLLGSAVTRRSVRTFSGAPMTWGAGTADPDAWSSDVRAFREAASDGPWGIVWAAGAATVSSSEREAAAELATLTALLHALRSEPPRGPGAFFLTSSAGGVYAGSAAPPFSEATTPHPVSAYGDLKVQQEAAASEALAGTCPVVIGRISNLYGPGQNLGKLQGLISRLAMAAATQEPLNIFVPLDTIRDYIYVDDAAAMALHWTGVALAEQPEGPVVRIIASGDSVTVGQLIRTMRVVTKRRIPIALGSHPSSASQALDLRLTPSGSGDLDALPATPLPAGVKAVYLDILRRLQQVRPTGPAPHAPR